MDRCACCNKLFDTKDVKDIVVCTAGCNNYYHLACTSLKDENKTRMKNAKKSWICDEGLESTEEEEQNFN